MKLFLALLLTLPVFAQSPDIKRNQKLQKLSAASTKAQAALATEIRSWTADCEAKGMQLGTIGANLVDCLPKPAQPAQPRPVPQKAPEK